jgi:hypothetical protein
MHQRIIITALLTLAFTFSMAAQEAAPPEAAAAETPPKCEGKPNGDILCDVWSKNGIAVDLRPRRASVAFTIRAWESHIGWPAVDYTITQESQRSTWYRFLENVAWIPRPLNFYFEAWITKCSAGGTAIRCSDALDSRPAQ